MDLAAAFGITDLPLPVLVRFIAYSRTAHAD
jgi:hypothetical protein